MLHSLARLRPALLATFALAPLLLGACANVTPYHRSLPDWVERVYVPIAENRSYEPGLEEKVTRAFIEELTAMGRLESVSRRQADVLVKVRIDEYRENIWDLGPDDVEDSREMVMKLSFEVYDPQDPETPLSDTQSFEVREVYDSDYRSTRMEQKADARESLMQRAGWMLQHKLINETTLRAP